MSVVDCPLLELILSVVDSLLLELIRCHSVRRTRNQLTVEGTSESLTSDSSNGGDIQQQQRRRHPTAATEETFNSIDVGEQYDSNSAGVQDDSIDAGEQYDSNSAGVQYGSTDAEEQYDSNSAVAVRQHWRRRAVAVR